MSATHETTLDEIEEAVGAGISPGDEAMRSRAENRVDGMILLAILLALVVVGLVVFFVGPTILGPVGLIATVVVSVILLAFTAGK